MDPYLCGSSRRRPVGLPVRTRMGSCCSCRHRSSCTPVPDIQGEASPRSPLPSFDWRIPLGELRRRHLGAELTAPNPSLRSTVGVEVTPDDQLPVHW